MKIFRVQIQMFHCEHTFRTVNEAAAILNKMQPECKWLFRFVEMLVRLLLVVPASSSEAERSFSALRRLKTWLRSTMSQARLNHICVLNVHSELLDTIDLDDIADNFISKNETRAQAFGKR